MVDFSRDGQFLSLVITSSFCAALILCRSFYRLFTHLRRRSSPSGLGRWHVDDTWVALSLFALAGRATCIGWSSTLAANVAANSDGATSNTSSDAQLSLKLLLPARLFYAMFLWCTKLTLLALYKRIFESIRLSQQVASAIEVFLYVSFLGVIFATLLECRPIQLFWNSDPAGGMCSKGRANLITMATLNLVSYVTLIIFPLPILWQLDLANKKKLQLSVLFCIGILIIITTLVRLPLILQDNVQSIRSMWATIEIVCACIVANAPFYYTVFREFIERYRPTAPSVDSQPVSENFSFSRRKTIVSMREGGNWPRNQSLVPIQNTTSGVSKIADMRRIFSNVELGTIRASRSGEQVSTKVGAGRRSIE